MMELPPIKLDHFKVLTDDTGIMQHAKYATPKRSEGYTTDDNARALIVCVKHHQIYNSRETEKLMTTYSSFLLHMQRSDGKFHNLLSYEHQFMDDIGSEDCGGRALWACGYAMDSNLPEEKKTLSKEIFDNGFQWVNDFKSLRAKAFVVLGLHHYSLAFPEDRNLIHNIQTLSNQLIENYKLNSSHKWRWFEPYLTYANARLTQALFNAYPSTKDHSCLKIGEVAFNFLMEHQMTADQFLPISNNGLKKGESNPALYDQQPLEASCMVEAALSGFRVKGDDKYLKIAGTAFSWFLGKNLKNVILYDSKTGGCYDGITPQGLNLNQGAESTISYLLARLELKKVMISQKVRI